jgi:hypothetical protein
MREIYYEKDFQDVQKKKKRAKMMVVITVIQKERCIVLSARGSAVAGERKNTRRKRVGVGVQVAVEERERRGKEETKKMTDAGGEEETQHAALRKCVSPWVIRHRGHFFCYHYFFSPSTFLHHFFLRLKFDLCRVPPARHTSTVTEWGGGNSAW